jgi:hypothetical protein
MTYDFATNTAVSIASPCFSAASGTRSANPALLSNNNATPSAPDYSIVSSGTASINSGTGVITYNGENANSNGDSSITETWDVTVTVDGYWLEGVSKAFPQITATIPPYCVTEDITVTALSSYSHTISPTFSSASFDLVLPAVTEGNRCDDSTTTYSVTAV